MPNPSVDETIDRLEADGVVLRSDIRKLEAEMSALQFRIDMVSDDVSGVAAVAEEAKQTASEAAEDTSESGSSTDDVGGLFDDQAEADTPPPFDPNAAEPYAYKVMEASGQIYIYIPKKPEQVESGDGTSSGKKVNEYAGGAYGGPHLGSETQPLCSKDAPPYSTSGYSDGCGQATIDCSWAHYGWHPVGSPLPMSSSVQERVVVAEFTVPLDPPEEGRDENTEIEGPSLKKVDLVGLKTWQEDCKQSWKEFDDPSAESVTRKVPIALVANGCITQLCVGVPFVERPGGGESGDPTQVDTRELGKSGLESGNPLSGKCQKSIDFYSYPTPAPSGISGSGKYQKTTKSEDPETGAVTTTVTRTNDEAEADKTVTDVLQLFDFTKPNISVTEMPVPTPVSTDSSGNETVSGPVFIVRDTGTSGECTTVKYTQIKLVDNRCPPPDVWLESGQNNSVTLKVRSWTKNGSGECVSGVTDYTFTPTSVDAPNCSGIKACIDCEFIRDTLGVSGMDAPPSVTADASGNIVIQPRKYVNGNGVGSSGCVSIANSGEPLTLTQTGAGTISTKKVTVLTGVTATASGLQFTTAELTVLDKTDGSGIPIAGTTCESGSSQNGG